jgi:hypothetical protein
MTARLDMVNRYLVATVCLAVFSSVQFALAEPLRQKAASGYVEPLDAGSLEKLKALYKRLIGAENRHDLAAVRPLIWASPSTLFVAKTATAAEGNWAGFWGTEVVMHHFHDLYQGPFRIDPDYDKEKVVGLRPTFRSRSPSPMPARRPCPSPFSWFCLDSYARGLAHGDRYRLADPASASLLNAKTKRI